MICPQCSKEFTPGRPHQKFCSTTCRSRHHLAGTDGGLRGVVSSVRKMRGGVVSVVLRFSPVEAHDALNVDVGTVLEVIK